MGAHSLYAPSAASRWVFCPGSILLAVQFPETGESSESAEGTAAHHIGSEQLLGRAVHVGSVAPNGVLLQQEMFDGAWLWVEDVQAIAAQRGLLGHLQVEQRVAIPRIHGECFGTPDTWLFDQAAGVLYVWDFKFGHEVVEAFENWQLILYVCGILDLLGVDGRTDEHITVDMRVIQPRAQHRQGRVRSWRVKASDLRAYFNQAHHAAHAGEQLGAQVTTGTHCKHCPARHQCPALRKAVGAACDYAEAGLPDGLPIDALGVELDLLDRMEALVKARRTGIEAEIEAHLLRGGRVQSWALEPTYGREAWAKDAAEVFALGDLFGVELRKPQEPITPKQAADKFKKQGVDGTVIRSYSQTPRTGSRLIRSDNLLAQIHHGFGRTPE